MTTYVDRPLPVAALVTWCLLGTAALCAAELPRVGESVPDFSLQSLGGEEATLSEHRGERPVVLVFFRGAW